MGSKKPPAPPKIEAPKPSAQELALLEAQTEATKQLMSQSNEQFGLAKEDRLKSMDYLQMLQNPSGLEGFEQDLVNQISDEYLKQYQRGIMEGPYADQFNTGLRDSLAGLSANGILNSTFGAETLQNLYKQRQFDLANAGGNAALQRLNLTKNFLDQKTAKQMDLFGTLYSGQRANSTLGSTMQGQAVGNMANITGQYAQNRLNAYNVDVQNKQAQYAYQQQLYQNKRSGLGSTLGTVGAIAGLALAPFTGGASVAASNALLGSAIGRGVGGFF